MIKLKGTIGVGGLKPCHECHVEAIRDTSSTSPRNKMYYVPLMVPGETEHRLTRDILNNLQMHKDYEETYYHLDIAANEAE